MATGSVASCERPVVHLPPREYWLYDPEVKISVPTPLDERGLVDAPQLFKAVGQLVDSEYDWTSAFNDPHHLQWPNRWYSREVRDVTARTANPHEFRNLAISKWILPRVLHNWIHYVTEPPPVPDNEVMFYRTEAQRVTTSLFVTVRNSQRFMHSSSLTKKEIHAKLTPNYRNLALQLKALAAVPAEFRLIDLSEYQSGNVRDMFKIEAALGKYSMIKTPDKALSIVRHVNAA